MKKIISYLISIMIIVGICFNMSMTTITAAARNPMLTIDTNAGGMQVWTNKTGFTPKITLKQSKITFTYYNNEVDRVLGKTKTKTVYPVYDVEITPKLTVDGGKTKYKSSSKTLKGSSLTISFKKGIYYEIDLYYNREATLKKAGLTNKVGVKCDSYMAQHWELKSVTNCGNYKLNRINNRVKF